MDKTEIYEFLQRKNIWYECTEHEALYSMADVSSVSLPHPEAEAKNLFLRDSKKQNYYLITVRGDKRVDLKEFRRKYQTAPLSFASADELKEIMGLIPGAVTPLGILSDTERRVQLFLDSEFTDQSGGIIGVHPNDNTATVWLKSEDLVRIIREHGNKLFMTDI